MASPNGAALAGYLLERVKNDVHFLHSQQLLDNNDRDAILSRLDGASHRVSSSSSNAGAVAALTNQFGATSVSGSSSALVAPPQQQQHQHSQPPPMPARHTYAAPPPQDNREKVRALWAYTQTQPDDLSFQKNDIIVITQKENEHWFRGFVQSDPSARTGLFPSNYVEPYSGDQASGYTPSAHSYYAPSTVSNDPEKAALQPYNMQASSAQYYSQPPPQQQYYQQPPAGPQAPSPAEPGKKNKFKMPGSGNGFGSTLAHAGVGGLGFGAGSAVASNLVNAIL